MYFVVNDLGDRLFKADALEPAVQALQRLIEADDAASMNHAVVHLSPEGVRLSVPVRLAPARRQLALVASEDGPSEAAARRHSTLGFREALA